MSNDVQEFLKQLEKQQPTVPIELQELQEQQEEEQNGTID